jgi:cytochrome c-type protein NapC
LELRRHRARGRIASSKSAEYKANDSRACLGCHQFSKEVLAKQQEMVRQIHAPVLEGKATCIDCHKGVGHAAP